MAINISNRRRSIVESEEASQHYKVHHKEDPSQAEIMKLCRLWRSIKCWSDVEDWLLINNVGTMLGNNWPNLIPTVEKVIYRQWMYKVYPVSIQYR